MIQALYYDFVTNYVKTRMYSTRYVECNSGDHIPCEGAKVHQVMPSARCKNLDKNIN